MANPAKRLESLLRLHRFELVAQNKHLKYKNPQGRVYIMSKTPSDIRAGHRMLATLKRVIADPPPTSEVIEEERQKRELEASIALEAQRKPSLVGVSGAGKGKKSKGIGIYYEEKTKKSTPVIRPVLTLAQLEELRREETARLARLEALRAEKEWARQLSKFRRARRQLDNDANELGKFLRVAALLAGSRRHAAQYLREQRRSLPLDAEQRERLVMALYRVNQMRLYENGDDEGLAEEIEKVIDQRIALMGGFLMDGRIPRLYRRFMRDRFRLTRGQLNEMRRAAAFVEYMTALGDVEIGNSLGSLRLNPLPKWLRDGVMGLRVGENKYEPAERF